MNMPNRFLKPTALLMAALAAGALQAAEPWPVVGRQGLVQMVMVPAALATDRAAYDAQLALLCEPERTCFVNFYSTEAGTPAALPLPPEVAAQATATYRQSQKNGVKRFLFACRLKLIGDECF